jgi:PBSX family phage terminase large subunit
MPLNLGQAEIAGSDARFKVAICGRRFGKTFLAIRELAKQCRYPNRRAYYVAPTYRQAKTIVWDQLKSKLYSLNWIDTVNESDLTIKLINGSRISLRGADNFDSLRGVGLDFLIMDEFAMIDQKAWTEVLRPTLSDRGGSAMFISTPMGQGNWAYDMYLKGKDDPDWSSFQYTTLDGGNVPEEEIEAARRDLDTRTFRQEYEATFETYSGVIHYNFGEENIVPYAHDIAGLSDVMLFCDFNTDPMSGIIAVRTDRGIHCIDEIAMYGSNTNELAQEVKNRYAGKNVTAFPDPAGVQRKTSANGNTDIKILEMAGFNVKYRHQHPLVKDRINAVNSLLLNSSNERRLLIDPKCKKLIESLRKHIYKEGTQIPDKNTGFDHFCDALGYGVEYLYPVKKPRAESRQPAMWGSY